MYKLLLYIGIAVLLNSCNLLPTKENTAIEICKKARANQKDNETWLDAANNYAEQNSSKKYKWKAQKSLDEKYYVVGFIDQDGMGPWWEVDIDQKIVKNIAMDEFLSRKYNMQRSTSTDEFEIVNIKQNELKISRKADNDNYSQIVYILKAGVKNKTNKVISGASIEGQINVIFPDKIESRRSYMEYGFTPRISVDNLWEPNTIKYFYLATQSFDKIYLNYKPEYIDVDITFGASDPIGYNFSALLKRIDLKESMKALLGEETTICSDNTFKNPEDVIGKEITNVEILQVIKTEMNSENYTYHKKKDDDRYYIITNKSTMEEFWCRNDDKRIEIYSYYSSKSFPEIKDFFKNHFSGKPDDNDFKDDNSFQCYGSETCYLVQGTKDKDKYKIEYSWQCD